MMSLLQDLRYGIRQLGYSRGLTAVIVLSLALGIGANTAIFTIINAVMLRALPVEDPQKLVTLAMGGDADLAFTNPIWEQVRDNQQVFSGTLAYATQRFDLSQGGESHFVQGMFVSGDFFRVLGVPAIQGRIFSPMDDHHGGGTSGPLAVISYQFWKRNYSGDADVIGKTVSVNQHKFVIVGVTPPWFNGLDIDRAFDIAIPLGCEPILRSGRSQLDDRSAWWLRILGRLPLGETLQHADAGMKAMSPAVFRATLPPDWNEGDQEDYLQNSFGVQPFSTGFSQAGKQYRTALFTLMAIVGLVLLIACANIANLLLARAIARQREFSVRIAIGASRGRLVRQLMTESILLAAMGAGGGLLLASWASRFLVHLLSTTKSPLDVDVSPDLRVFAFTAGISFLTAVIFGLAPAVRATLVKLNQALKENAGAAQGGSRFNLGKALVAGQIALSLVLLVGAGLFLGTLRNLLTTDSGFNRHNVLIITADAQQAAILPSDRVRVFREILDRVRATPGVTNAGSSFIAPISGLGWNGFTYPQDYVPKSRWDTMVLFNRVSPQYFQTMQTPLLRGRDFNDHDNLSAPKVMIIGESTARRFFGSSDPIGKTIAIDTMRKPREQETYEVVGVVKDTKYRDINEEPALTAFFASEQDTDPSPSMRYAVRSEVPVETLIASVRTAIGEQHKDISLEFRNFEVMVNDSLVQPRVVALLSSAFGLLALLLAMVGLYGITAYGVTRRRAEIGIRVALGAPQLSVVWLVLRDVMLLLASGMVLGLLAALTAGRLIASLLYGVHADDPAQLAAAAVILAAATALAAYLPARRAAKVDPMVALRYE